VNLVSPYGKLSETYGEGKIQMKHGRAFYEYQAAEDGWRELKELHGCEPYYTVDAFISGFSMGIKWLKKIRRKHRTTKRSPAIAALHKLYEACMYVDSIGELHGRIDGKLLDSARKVLQRSGVR
jgi:hypothetical protein